MNQIIHNNKTNCFISLYSFQKTFGLYVFLSLFLYSDLAAQQKQTMTPDVYSQWNRIQNVMISDSGSTVIYELNKEIGNKILKVYSADTDTTYTFERANDAVLDKDGNFVFFRKVIDYDTLRSLKRKKTAKDKLPIDSLVIFDINNNAVTEIPELESFKTPEKYSGYLAYLIKEAKIKKDTTEKEKKDKKDSKDKIFTLIIKDLHSAEQDTFFSVMDYVFCKEGKKLAFTSKTKDSIALTSIYVYNLENKTSDRVSETNGKVLHLTFDKFGDQLAFYLDEDTLKSVVRPLELFHWNAFTKSSKKLTDNQAELLPQNWILSEHRKLEFSESGQRLFFGISPAPLIKDTTLLEDEIVNVEIWHHDDPRIYTQQESMSERLKKQSFLTFIDLADSTFQTLETQQLKEVAISLKKDGRFALLKDEHPYLKEITWEGYTGKDLYIKDLKTKVTTQIATQQSGSSVFSPGGNFVYWYNNSDTIWKAYDVNKKNILNLTTNKTGIFYDELNDEPSAPSSYGIAGWTYDDQYAYIYDRYDIWKVNPSFPSSAIRLTDGRENKKRYRYIHLDKENEYIDENKSLLLHAVDEISKAESYFSLNPQSGESKFLYGGEFALTRNITKAEKNTTLIFTSQNFDIFPDLRLTDLSFEAVKQISHANPQQQNYGWGSASLFSWQHYNGKQNDGMLFFPPDFDSEKQYPLIVNFYDRSSDNLHSHRAPQAGRSTINYSYYTNKGYVIFNPDVHYTIGYPGQSAYDAVMSGVEALTALGYIDTSRMSLQGHSWGGYQIAYILVKTDKFKCAESGAPVVNMISAYGGIRWESGMSRMFQYEKTQSRIGESLWENPLLYMENSPIFEMFKVKTPVLILHNDKDGAVPWYQGIEYYMALRRLGKECWLLNYNGEPHWPVKWQNRLDFNIRMEQFFDHYLMDKPMPGWMKEGISPLEKGILSKY